MIRLCELNKDPAKYAGEVEIAGWVRTVRDSKNIGFIELSDGSCFRNVQVVYENNIPNDIIKQINTGCAISVVGDLVLTPDAKQPFEVKAREIKIEGLCASDYPMQKKRHSLGVSAHNAAPQAANQHLPGHLQGTQRSCAGHTPLL